MIVVLDASVLARVILGESLAEEIALGIARARAAGARLVTLPLARYEIGNSALKSAREERWSNMAAAVAAAVRGLENVEDVHCRVGRAADLAAKHDLSFYDACYLGLALDLGGRLWTYDFKLGLAAEVESARIGPLEMTASGPAVPAAADDLRERLQDGLSGRAAL